MHPENSISRQTRFVTFSQGLELESGRVLAPVRVAYRTWGRLKETRDNAVLVCHAFTGSADADTWWSELFGEGRSLNPDEDFIVCSNVLGSCYGSTGPMSINPHTGRGYASEFPAITIRDMVQLQLMLIDALNIRSLRLVIGGSLGGMQALEWAVMGGERVHAAVVIATTGRHSPWCIAFDEAQREAIRADEKYCNGRYSAEHPPVDGLAVARMIAMCTYRTPESFLQRFGRDQDRRGSFEAEKYLRYHGRKLSQRFDANSYIALTKAMDSHDLARGRSSYHTALRSITQPTLVVSVDSDLLYVPREQADLAHTIPNARLAWINSVDGHDGFLIEGRALNDLVASFRQWPAVRSSRIAC